MESITLLGTHSGNRIYHVDGWLACTCPLWPDVSDENSFRATRKPPACHHTWDAMRNGLDAQEAAAQLIDGQIIVPIFFKENHKIDLFIPVVVMREFSTHGLSPVFAWPRRDNQDPICFLDTHEGRWAIRQSLLEWLRSQYRHVPPCLQPIHKGYAFSRRERDALDGKDTSAKVLASVYHLSDWTGAPDRMCYDCLMRTNFSDAPGMNDDLIPDI